MSVADDVQKIFDNMPKVFVPEKARGVNATVQVILTGEGGGNWGVSINNGDIAVTKGLVPNPDLTLTMDAQDYVNLTRGNANPMTLFMMGRIQMEGDMALALKFQQMFDAP